jgi:phosphate transport system permease protein
MTDATHKATRHAIKANLKKRYSSESRFKWFGITMVCMALVSCLILLAAIFMQAIPAFTETRLVLDVKMTAEKLDPSGKRNPDEIRASADVAGVIADSLIEKFPHAETDGGLDAILELYSNISTTEVVKKIAANPSLIGKTERVSIALNDDLDMYLKGGFGAEKKSSQTLKAIRPTLDGQSEFVIDDASKIKFHGFETVIAQNQLQSQLQTGFVLDADKPSLILGYNGGIYKVNKITPNSLFANVLITPASNGASSNIELISIEQPENGRPISDLLVAYGHALKQRGLLNNRPNITLFTHADSNEPEMAGLLSALVGTFLTLILTFAITVPVGVMAAIFLEEFAPKNRWTDFIEVNINNLAAVPSIIFGLLGFSVFLHFFGMPRSAPLVGGIVLALMSLPVIIIASRAALKAVPPSIREAALGVGASKIQSVFHHVLPLATPGIMTGSILAMAHALGETAPLLMIGMVAFIADIPNGFLDSATVLPVEIYMWAGRPERSWDARTSAAILILLLFMVLMNIIAIAVRRKFEKRW